MDCRTSVEEKSEVGRSISIEIPRELVNEEYERELSKTMAHVHVKGFRQGRAPKAMVAKLYGPQIQGEVLKKVISDAYQEAVQNHSLEVVGFPEISIDNEEELDKDLLVRAEVSVYPKPEVKNYLGLEFNVEVEASSEGRIAERIEGLREQQAELTPISDRVVAQMGDTAQVNYAGTIDGASFEGSSGEDAYVDMGSGKSLPGIEEALVGLTVGEEKSVEVVMPKESGKDVVGKEAEYKLLLKGLFTRVLPELDDEFAKKTKLAEDVAGLKIAIREQIERDAKRVNQIAREDKLFAALIENNPFEVPQVLTDEEIRAILFEMRLLDPRQDSSYQIDVARFRDVLGKTAEFRVRRAIILARIIEKEDMKFSDDEVDSWLGEMVASEGVSREEINKIYGFPKQMSRLKDMMASRKMIEKLLGASKIQEETKGKP
jgi:trigger factor